MMSIELQATLRAQVEKFLNLCLYENATYLAERLVAEDDSEDNLHLLATCFHRSGKQNRVVSLLSPSCTSMKNRYLLALSLYETNNSVAARNVLIDFEPSPMLTNPFECREKLRAALQSPIPGGPAGLYLLGCMSRDELCAEHAIVYFQLCLEKDPFYWMAYEELCLLSPLYDADPEVFFGTERCFTDSLKKLDLTGNITEIGDKKGQRMELDEMPPPATIMTSPGNVIMTRGRQQRQQTSRGSERLGPPAPRKSAKSETAPRKKMPRATRTTKQEVEAKPTANGFKASMALLGSIATALQKLNQYECQDALKHFQSLPVNQFKSGWVQHQIGRCYFEMCEYVEASKVFQAMRKLEPYRMEGLETYSTVLWHLQKDVELGCLARDVAEYEKTSPAVWCTVGNCFSRQKEHEAALKFFKRAIQVNPRFTYAHTLCGHEYVANEDLDKAEDCYRQALSCDANHYNAWYGLGTICYRQEKFIEAEQNFLRALGVNPRSSLLHCYLGMVMLSSGKYQQALEKLKIATDLQPRNPQAKFQRANVLLSLNRNEEAYEELMIVRNYAPKESSVSFLLGKVCKRMGRIEEALEHFTNAAFFSSKDNNTIKSEIERIKDADTDDDPTI